MLPRKDWPKGPWDNEPNELKWRDKETGLQCYIRRNDFGALLGYVNIPQKHWLYEVYHFDCDHIHGGITFCGFIDEKWYIGYDCAHGYDFAPGLGYGLNCAPATAYKTINYVKFNCKILAKYLKNHEKQLKLVMKD